MGTIQQFDYSIDPDEALLWQYQPAVNLQSLLTSKGEWYAENHAGFWQSWYDDVFNLQTANDFGLSVWAIILGVPLIGAAQPPDARAVFGFRPYSLNFQHSNFTRDNVGLTLTTEEKRLILRLRYFQLVSDGCADSINPMLAYLFADIGRVYVLDGLDMTCEYVFTFIPDPRLLYVFTNFDILPRPAGVELSILVNPGDSFGFGPYYLNFHASNFGGGA